jgi:uncharacterized protein YjaZ
MKKIKFLIVCCICTTIIFSACKKQDAKVVSEMDEVKQLAYKAGFNTDKIFKFGNQYLVEGDIRVTKEELKEMAEKKSSNFLNLANTEHYRTFGIVNGNRTITVALETNQNNFAAATDEAIARYNALPLRIKFQRVNGSADITIRTFFEQSNVLGGAGFPDFFSGNPYNEILLNTFFYNNNVETNALATTIAHEMGHCIGFRHTDFYNRSFSCGAGAPDLDGFEPNGALYIPNTPIGPEAGSWMLACGSTAAGYNRPFTTGDKIALNYVY